MLYVDHPYKKAFTFAIGFIESSIISTIRIANIIEKETKIPLLPFIDYLFVPMVLVQPFSSNQPILTLLISKRKLMFFMFPKNHIMQRN